MTNRKQSNRNLVLIAGLIVAVAVVTGAVLLLSPTAGPPAADTALISPTDYQSQFTDEPHFLLDVRTPEEFGTGHIAGAANISVQTLADRLSEVPQDQPIVVYCRSGNRSAQAAQILQAAGYTGVYDLGGVIDWTAAGLPLQQAAANSSYNQE